MDGVLDAMLLTLYNDSITLLLKNKTKFGIECFYSFHSFIAK